MEKQKNLASENPERYNSDLAVSYFNYGIFSSDDAMLEKALELAKTRPDHPLCKRIIAAME